MLDSEWDPKPGDKAWLWDGLPEGGIPVTIVRTEPGHGDIYEVRYAEKDRFGERASFSADRLELSPR